MRVLLVSPSSVQSGPAQAGGVAGYVGDLAVSLAGSGHRVGVVSSGWAYAPGLLGRRPGGCRPVRLETQHEIERFQILNSPVLAPSLWQFRGPEDEVDQTGVLRSFGRVLRWFSPDAVHIHGFEGFCAGIVEASVRAGAACLVSLHNHHPFCPQVYLMHGRRSPCADYRGGLACETCESSIDRGAERRRRAGDRSIPPPAITPPPLPPVQTFHDEGSPTSATAVLWSYAHPHWQPVESEAIDPVRARHAANRYGVRRRAYVRALNTAHSVIAVSGRVAEIARSMGVEPSRLSVLPIGSWAAESAARPPPPTDPEPLRLVFLGFNNYYKGLPMLVDALGLLAPSYRARIHLGAFGSGCESIRARAEALRPSLAGIELGGPYRREDAAALLGNRHLGVVPSVWSDNGPQTAIEMRSLGVPVLGARMGGIPDIIEHGRDGLLFRGNDRVDLARTLARALREPGLVSRLRATVRPWITMSRHADTLAGRYEIALSFASGRG